MPAVEAQTLVPRQTQAPTRQNGDRITVTGCLLLGPYGDFTVSKTIASPGSIMTSVAWKLEGSQALLGHVLEKVEVTGTMLRTPSETLQAVGGGARRRPTDRDGEASYRLRVSTIKKVVGGCS